MGFLSYNPTDGRLIASYEEHTDREVEQILQRSHDAWKQWSARPLSEPRGVSEPPCGPSRNACSMNMPLDRFRDGQAFRRGSGRDQEIGLRRPAFRWRRPGLRRRRADPRHTGEDRLSVDRPDLSVSCRGTCPSGRSCASSYRPPSSATPSSSSMPKRFRDRQRQSRSSSSTPVRPTGFIPIS